MLENPDLWLINDVSIGGSIYTKADILAALNLEDILFPTVDDVLLANYFTAVINIYNGIDAALIAPTLVLVEQY